MRRFMRIAVMRGNRLVGFITTAQPFDDYARYLARQVRRSFRRKMRGRPGYSIAVVTFDKPDRVKGGVA